MDDISFRSQRLSDINRMVQDGTLTALSKQWFDLSIHYRYSYNFDWLGLPIIQYPQDIILLQELIWSTKPDLIIETGVARGGSLVLSASMMLILDFVATERSSALTGVATPKVIGVELALSDENRSALRSHPLFPFIHLVDGSSTSSDTVREVERLVAESSSSNCMVILDSNHSHHHVLNELKLYAKFVPIGGYIVVLDTVIENLNPKLHDRRRWHDGNSPMTAVYEFLEDGDFEVVQDFTKKLLLTAAPDGVLRRIR